MTIQAFKKRVKELGYTLSDADLKIAFNAYKELKVYIKDDDQKLPRVYDSENDYYFNLPDWCNDAYKRDGWIKAKSIKDVLE